MKSERKHAFNQSDYDCLGTGTMTSEKGKIPKILRKDMATDIEIIRRRFQFKMFFPNPENPVKPETPLWETSQNHWLKHLALSSHQTHKALRPESRAATGTAGAAFCFRGRSLSESFRCAMVSRLSTRQMETQLQVLQRTRTCILDI